MAWHSVSAVFPHLTHQLCYTPHFCMHTSSHQPVQLHCYCLMWTYRTERVRCWTLNQICGRVFRALLRTNAELCDQMARFANFSVLQQTLRVKEINHTDLMLHFHSFCIYSLCFESLNPISLFVKHERVCVISMYTRRMNSSINKWVLKYFINLIHGGSSMCANIRARSAWAHSFAKWENTCFCFNTTTQIA